MRSAKHIQQLCEPLVPLNMDWAIMEGCARETDNQKSAQKSTSNPQGQASSSRRQATKGIHTIHGEKSQRT